MTAGVAVALVLWLAGSAAAVPVWTKVGARRTAAGVAAVVVLAAAALLLGVVAALGLVDPGRGPWVEGLVPVLAVTASVVVGGPVSTRILGLADTSDRALHPGATVRVQRLVLRGGAWIGALERLAITSALLAGWPEGLAVVVAIKGLARYPELKTPDSGAGERFIIGTFASVCWASGCAGAAALLLGG